MELTNIKSEAMDYFLSLSKDIIPETKEFLFDLMAETARAENLTDQYKEDRIYLISHLHRLLSGIDREISKPK
jgi:hypothetical protein